MIWTAVGVVAAVGMWTWDRMNAKPEPKMPAESEPAAVQEAPKVLETSGSEQDANSPNTEP